METLLLANLSEGVELKKENVNMKLQEKLVDQQRHLHETSKDQEA